MTPFFLKNIYLKLFKIDDTPQKIALGAGLGVFAGIIPGIGVLAALFLAFVLRANRAGALLGALLTNTWLSFVTFILAVRAGSILFGIDWQILYQRWAVFLKELRLSDLFKSSVLEIILPVLAGYLVVAFFSGLLVYLVTFTVLKLRKKGTVL